MLSIFLIGIALGMDAFSIALSIGTLNLSTKKEIIISLCVGFMHIIMTLSGVFLGNQILNIFNIDLKILITLILFYLATVMYLERNKDKKVKIVSLLNILLFAFSVSIDSFSIGIGLKGLSNHITLSATVFGICSACLTYIGLLLGKYSVKLLKENSTKLGVAILLIIAIVNLCKVLFN